MNDAHPQRSLLWRALQVLARIATTMLFDLKVRGTQHVPETGGVLLVANHQSCLDPVLVAVRLCRPVSYMAKSELFENRWFAWLIRSLHAFPVRQGRGDVAAIKETIRRLHEGHVVNVYPEGSRTLDGEIGPIEPGVALVVRRAGLPIVPVVVDGAFQAWPRQRGIFRAHPIHVVFGPAMRVENLTNQQILELIGQTLQQMLVELRRRPATPSRRGRGPCGRRTGAGEVNVDHRSVVSPATP